MDNPLNDDQIRFIQLSRRLKKHLGISPASKGMMDLLELCCDKIEELEKQKEEL
jgi:hypothetical protein